MDINDYAKAYDLSKQIKESKKVTMAVYGGLTMSSSISLFLFSKYRLGSLSTTFSIPDLLLHQSIPMCGIAYHFAKTCPEGFVIARYLGITGKSLGVDSLYNLDLITHIVENDPHVSFADALAHTIPDSYELKREQAAVVDEDSILGLLNDMDVNSHDIEFYDEETANQFLTVPTVEDRYNYQSSPDIRDFVILEQLPSLLYCLESDSIDECIPRLNKFSQQIKSSNEKSSDSSIDNWAQEILDSIPLIKPQVLESWFRVTGYSNSCDDFDKIKEFELNEFEKLSKN
eukprot:gene19293-25153_t